MIAHCAVVFLGFFALQFISYLLITVNFRAVAAAKYSWTAGTDLILSALSFFLIQRVAHAATNDAWAGYAGRRSRCAGRHLAIEATMERG